MLFRNAGYLNFGTSLSFSSTYTVNLRERIIHNEISRVIFNSDSSPGLVTIMTVLGVSHLTLALPIFLDTSRTPTAVSARRLVGVMMRCRPLDPGIGAAESLASVSCTLVSIDLGRTLEGSEGCAAGVLGRVPSSAWWRAIGVVGSGLLIDARGAGETSVDDESLNPEFAVVVADLEDMEEETEERAVEDREELAASTAAPASAPASATLAMIWTSFESVVSWIMLVVKGSSMRVISRLG